MSYELLNKIINILSYNNIDRNIYFEYFRVVKYDNDKYIKTKLSLLEETVAYNVGVFYGLRDKKILKYIK